MTSEISLKRLLTGAGTLGSATGLAAGLALVQAALLVRLLGLEAFGTLVILQIYTVIIWTLCNPASWQPFIARAQTLLAEHKQEDFVTLLSFCARTDLMAACISVALGAAGAYGLAQFHLWPTHLPQEEMAQLASAAMITVFFLQLSSLPIGYFRLKRDIAVLAWQKLGAASIMTLAVGAAWIYGASFLQCVWLWIFIRGMEFASLYLLMHIAWRREKIAVSYHKQTLSFPGFHKALVTSYGQNLAFNIVESADVAAAGLIIGTEAAGGLRIIKNLAGMIQLLGQPLKQVFYPDVSALLAHRKTEQLLHLLSHFWRLLFVVVVIAMIGFLFFGDIALEILRGAKAPELFFPGLLYMAGASLNLLATPLMPLYYARQWHEVHQRFLNILTPLFVLELCMNGKEFGIDGVAMAYAEFYTAYLLLAGSWLWLRRRYFFEVSP